MTYPFFFVFFLWLLAMMRAPGRVEPVIIDPNLTNLNPATAGPLPCPPKSPRR